MKRIIPIAIALAVAVFGGLLTLAQLNKLSDVRLEPTRTELPGSRTVALKAQKYVLWIESRGGNLANFDVSADQVNVEVRPVGGAPLKLSGYGGSFTTSSGGRGASAFATVRPPLAGRYVISGDAGSIANRVHDPSVVLGNPTGGALLLLIFGIVLVAFGVIGAIVAAILAVVLPHKDNKSDSPQSPVTGGDPFNAG